MSGIPFWDDDPEAWDHVVLGPHTLPGLAEITNLTKAEKVDVKSPSGSTGASITCSGAEPATLDIVLRVWTREQWGKLQIILPELQPKKPKGTPYDIAHPKTALRNIKAVYIQEISGPNNVESGIQEITFKCVEYLQPSSHPTTTPKTSQGIGTFENQLVDPPKPPSHTPPAP
jgi:hypothetical protein